MQTRRELLQGLIVAVGGAAALSACRGTARLVATPQGAERRFYTANEMGLVTRVSDLVIPRTETPGAVDVNVPGYLDGLMSDWASAETQREHREALQQITARLDAATGNFLSAGDTEANRALAALDSAAFADGNNLGGYRALKSYITQAYFATEEGAIQELKWVAVPGRWDPSVDITAAE